jgi:hypothetical protein
MEIILEKYENLIQFLSSFVSDECGSFEELTDVFVESCTSEAVHRVIDEINILLKDKDMDFNYLQEISNVHFGSEQEYMKSLEIIKNRMEIKLLDLENKIN